MLSRPYLCHTHLTLTPSPPSHAPIPIPAQVRAASFPADADAGAGSAAAAVEALSAEEMSCLSPQAGAGWGVEWVSEDVRQSKRPELGAAKWVGLE